MSNLPEGFEGFVNPKGKEILINLKNGCGNISDLRHVFNDNKGAFKTYQARDLAYCHVLGWLHEYNQYLTERYPDDDRSEIEKWIALASSTYGVQRLTDNCSNLAILLRTRDWRNASDPISPMNINTGAATVDSDNVADSIEPDIDGDVPESAGRGDVIRNAQVRLRCIFTLLLSLLLLLYFSRATTTPKILLRSLSHL